MCNRILELVERIKIPGVRAVDVINKPLLVRSNEKKVKDATDDVTRKPDLGFVLLPNSGLSLLALPGTLVF
jgi:hypothetical protein